MAWSIPFLPQLFEPTSAVPGAGPTPSDRSLELADERRPARPTRRARNRDVTAVAREPVGPLAGKPRTGASSAGRQVASNGPPSSFEARFAPVAGLPAAGTRVEPLPAFAPSMSGQASGAVLSGRGLY
jgi:hypothetical protein